MTMEDNERREDDERATANGAGSRSNGNSSRLRTLPMSILIWYFVSGGPIGIEPAVRSAGYSFAILGFIIGPLVWSVPEALMTAELSTAFPEAAGGVAWVETAFGSPMMGWMFGYTSWVSGAIDNAIYPVLILDYLAHMYDLQLQSHRFLRFGLLACISCLLSLVNWLGLDIVGNIAIVLAGIAMSPFVVLCILGAAQVEPDRWFFTVASNNATTTNSDLSPVEDDTRTPPVINWSVFLNNLFWNLNSFDSAANFAGDVDDTSRTMPRSLAISVLLVILGYLVPLVVVIGALDSSIYTYEDWDDGFLASAASSIVGPWLGAWTVIAATVSNIGLYEAELSTDSLQLAGMAQRRYLPRILGTQSSRGTPTYGIIIGTIVILLFISMSELDDLVETLNFNYGISLLLEYAAFIWLRVTKSGMSRPYRVPFGLKTICLIVAPAILATTSLLLMASWTTYAICTAVNIFGAGLYYGCCKSKSEDYFTVDDSSEDNNTMLSVETELMNGPGARPTKECLLR